MQRQAPETPVWSDPSLMSPPRLCSGDGRRGTMSPRVESLSLTPRVQSSSRPSPLSGSVISGSFFG